MVRVFLLVAATAAVPSVPAPAADTPDPPPVVSRAEFNSLAARVARLEASTGLGLAATTIPPGYHAHTKADGSVIVHHDSNFGDPVAHEGVAYPWPKTGFPGDVVFQQNCPGGVCPTPTAAASCPTGTCPTAAAPVVGSYRYTARMGFSVGNAGLFPRVRFAWDTRPRLFGRFFGRW